MSNDELPPTETEAQLGNIASDVSRCADALERIADALEKLTENKE